MQINYQGVGSGAGIKQFTQNLVSFGASDAAMTDKEIAAVKQGVVLIPATAGSIVLAYNLPGVENLKLSREAYAGIFLGKITKWNDPAITKTNEGAKLPDSAITVCERSDGSGTTFVFTKHLSAISPEFKDKVGEGTSVTWTTGVAGKGNDGVTALIKQNKGAIGYVEYGYAKNNKLTIRGTPEQGRRVCDGNDRIRRSHFGDHSVSRRICFAHGLLIRMEKTAIRSLLLRGCCCTINMTMPRSLQPLRNLSAGVWRTGRSSPRNSVISLCPRKWSTKNLEALKTVQ